MSRHRSGVGGARPLLGVEELDVADAGRAARDALDRLDEMGRIKRNRRWGYDFFATRSPVWLDRMERLVEATAAPPAAAGR